MPLLTKIFAAEIMLRNKSRPNFPPSQNQLCTCSFVPSVNKDWSGTASKIV